MLVAGKTALLSSLAHIVQIGSQSATIAGRKLGLHRCDLVDDRIQDAARLLPPRLTFRFVRAIPEEFLEDHRCPRHKQDDKASTFQRP
jgi:hypothetical protein